MPWKNRRGRPRCWRQSRTFIIRLPCLNDVTLMRCSVKHKFRSTACDWSLRCCLRVCLSSAYVYTYVCIIVDESFEQRRRGSSEQTRSRPLTDVSHDDLIYTTYEKPCLPRARYIFNTLHPITITALKRVLSRFPFRYVNSLSTFFTQIRKSYTCCLAKTRVEIDSSISAFVFIRVLIFHGILFSFIPRYFIDP